MQTDIGLSDSRQVQRPKVGVMLPILSQDGTRLKRVPEFAHLAEQMDFDSLWIGDHLVFKFPLLDSSIVLATAATVTNRIELGYCVLLLALRPLAWAAKQIASLQVLSTNRIIVGVGVGGENPEEWAAAGVPMGERGRRTDMALTALPELLAGRPFRSNDLLETHIPALLPTAQQPPIWIGGGSVSALRRTVRFGDSWIGLWAGPERVRRVKEQLELLANEWKRPVPALAMAIPTQVNANRNKAHEEMARYVNAEMRYPFEKVRDRLAMGSIEDVAGYLSRFVAAGVSHFVLMPTGDDPYAQYEELSRVRTMLLAAHESV